MTTLIVVERPENWPLEIPDAQVVTASDYLPDPRFAELNRAKVFNLCRSYAYQTAGYYVSLLAEAREHRPLPSVTTTQDLRQSSLVRIASETTELLVQQTLAPIKSDRFVLSIYFGRNMVQRYDRLAQCIGDSLRRVGAGTFGQQPIDRDRIAEPDGDFPQARPTTVPRPGLERGPGHDCIGVLQCRLGI